VRHEIKLVVLVFLLVVGPAVGLSFLTGRILGNWQVVLQKRMETTAGKALESAAVGWGARLEGIRKGLCDGLATQAPIRVAAECAAANPWVAGFFLFQRERGLVYPGAREQPLSFAPRDGQANPPAIGLPHGSLLLSAVSNRAAMIGECRQILEQPDLPGDLACRLELHLARLYRDDGQNEEAGKRLLHVARFLGGNGGAPPPAPGPPAGIRLAWPRDAEEGFYYDLIALEMLADLSVSAGDRARARDAEGELMRRVLSRCDELAPLQRQRLLAHVAQAGVLADGAAGDKGGVAPLPRWLVAQWRALEKACALSGAAHAKIEQEMGRALQSGVVASSGWTRVDIGGSGFLMALLSEATPGLGGGALGIELDNEALGVALAQTAADLGRGSGLTIRYAVADAAGRRVAASHEGPDRKGPGPLLAERRLAGPLDRVVLSAYPADAQAFLANARLQTRLYGWGGSVLVVSVLLGGWLIWREAAGEIRRARERSEFAAAVSHDLRTPLASMRMLAESLHLGRIEDAEKRKRFLEIILKESDRLSRLTDRALYFIQYGQGALRYRLTEGNVAVLVKDVVETFATGIEGKIREVNVSDEGTPPEAAAPPARTEDQGAPAEWAIDLTLNRDVPPVQFDAGALEQVFFNLLDNAVKYSRGRRQVEVSVLPDGRGRHVVVSVRDFGVGIDRKDIRRIFRAYHRGKGSANTVGLGLGLALCRDIVKAHQGRIEVESVPERGSTFKVILPCTA
jgi:signal transduction histidine kinase